jgi:carbon-monoxide dehydrogenase large subunit
VTVGKPDALPAMAVPEGAGDVWKLTLETPMGPQSMIAVLNIADETVSGKIQSEMGAQSVSGTVSGNCLAWTMKVTKPMPIELGFNVKLSGDTMTGDVALGTFGTASLTGRRA